MQVVTAPPVYVLAGGQSTRMGQDKATLQLLETPFWRWLQLRLTAQGHAVFLLSAKEEHRHLDIPCIPEKRAGGGPLAGLEAALEHEDIGPVFLLSCDMPLLPIWALALLQENHLNAPDVPVVLQIEGRTCPTVGLYPQRTLPHVTMALDAGRRAMMPLLHELEAQNVEVSRDPRYQAAEFMNVNTPEQWLQLKTYTKQNRKKW